MKNFDPEMMRGAGGQILSPGAPVPGASIMVRPTPDDKNLP
jgi:hypothetical protein